MNCVRRSLSPLRVVVSCSGGFFERYRRAGGGGRHWILLVLASVLPPPVGWWYEGRLAVEVNEMAESQKNGGT